MYVCIYIYILILMFIDGIMSYATHSQCHLFCYRLLLRNMEQRLMGTFQLWKMMDTSTGISLIIWLKQG